MQYIILNTNQTLNVLLLVSPLWYRYPISRVLHLATWDWLIVLLGLAEFVLSTAWVNESGSWWLLALWIIKLDVLVINNVVLPICSLVVNHVLNAVLMTLHSKEGVRCTSNALHWAAYCFIFFQNHVILLCKWHQPHIIRVLKLCLSPLVEVLLLHTEGQLFFFSHIMHRLVCAHSFVVNHVLSLGICDLLFRLLDGALLKVIIH